MLTMARTLGVLAMAAVLILGLAAASPAHAQGIVEMPRFDFPSKDGAWGCRFSNGCRAVDGTTTGQRGAGR